MQLKGKILSSKTIVLLVLQFFIVHIYLQGMVDCSKVYDYPCAPWVLPFYFSSAYVILINMFLVIYYFSDAPFMQYHNIYRIMRYGRVRYSIVNIIAIMVEAVLYMVTSLVFSVVCLAGHIEFTTSWGKLLYTIGATNDTKNAKLFIDVSYDIINDFSPFQAMGRMLAIGTLVIAFVGVLMYAVSLYFSRSVAIITAIIMTALAFITVDAVPAIGKVLGLISPVSWLYITKIDSAYMGVHILPPAGYIYTFLIIGITLCVSLIIIKSKTVEYEFYKED